MIINNNSTVFQEHGVELARLATWFTLNQPNIDTNVCGFFDIAQMKDTLSLVDGGLTQHEQNILADLQSRYNYTFKRPYACQVVCYLFGWVFGFLYLQLTVDGISSLARFN